MTVQSQEMKSLGRKAAIALAILVLLAIPFITDVVGGNAALSLITRILIYSIAAASLNFVLGYGGMISLGHAAFFGIGGYVVGLLFVHYTDDTPLLGLIPGTNQLLITVPAAILVSGLLALVIGALSLRTGGVQFIMITLAFAQMIFFFFVSLKAYGGEDGIIVRRTNEFLGLNMRDRLTLYYVILGFWAAFMLALWRLIHSSFGTVLRGMKQNERRMAALGFAPYRYKLYAFVLSGMGCGLAGALMANFLRFASPDMLHWTKSAALITMVILGGVGSFFGPLLGTAAYLVLETELAALTEYWQFWLGLILLAVVLGTQGGLNALIARGFALIFRGRT